MRLLATLVSATFVLSACGENESPTDAAEDRVEQAAEASARQSGSDIVAFGLTEWQLLDAELVDSSGRDLGDVERVMRNAAGEVDRLLIEVEDSNPDRFVYVPIDGLSPLKRGDDTDLSSAMSMADIDALPDVDISSL